MLSAAGRPRPSATLRLQNMIGVSLQNWDVEGPGHQLAVLTQLGRLAIGDGA